MSITDFLTYILPFICALILSAVLIIWIKKIALKLGIVDLPDQERKTHPKPTPLLGGIGLYLAFLAVLLACLALGMFNDGIIKIEQISGIVVGGLILIIGGALDDKIKLKPWQSFLFPVVASAVAVISGIAVKYVTNPFIAGTGPYGRALFYFDWVNLEVVSFGVLFSFLWIIGMIYTTKFLDGLDGLASGVGVIGAVILFIVSLFWDVPMSGTSILCLIFAGSLAGFLIFNFYPAKIFLGEGGATFIGFMLGSLSIISGGKIATALLIMGVPILDVAFVIFRRLFSGSHIYQGDRQHLHYRLIDAGLSHKQTVLFYYLLSFVFGSMSLFLQSSYKIAALSVLALIMIVMVITVTRKRLVI